VRIYGFFSTFSNWFWSLFRVAGPGHVFRIGKGPIDYSNNNRMGVSSKENQQRTFQIWSTRGSTVLKTL